MNRIIYLLLGILFLQLNIFLYIKFIYEEPQQPLQYKNNKKVILHSNKCKNIALEKLVQSSIEEIMKKSKKLPQSTQYTIWDKEMITHISKKILQKPKKKQIHKKTIKPISMTKRVESYAKKKLGKKYVWGATGPNKFDCSGFTQEVFRSTAGICLPRVSREQAKVGKYIKYENLKRGDMVFFDTEHKFTGKVNHVGIYLSNGNFIHASSAKKSVIITNFNKKPFYKRRFLWGRRVVKRP